MISAAFKNTGFRVSGHAGAGPYGFDIVCAGVSALVTHTVRLMNNAGYHFDLTESVDGFVAVEVRVTPINTLDVVGALCASLADIAEAYPGTIDIHDYRKERDDE